MPSTLPNPASYQRNALWRNLLLTIGINTVAGLFLSLTSNSPLWRVMLTSQAIGLVVYAAVTLIFTVVKPSPRREPFYLFGAITLAAIMGFLVNWLLRYQIDELNQILREYPSYLLVSLLVMMLAAGVTASILWGREKASRLELAYHAEQARRDEQEKQLIQAQLRMLQAQIEPHFLFNTLASVQSLIDPAPDAAKQMLGLFNDYLRASLARTRLAQSTVRQEVDLLSAYLGILKIRMAERLQFALECPADLLDAALPPMLLQPLVENAIRHGLEPKIDGGNVRIVLSRQGETLLATVSDTGLGLSTHSHGSGVGLANVRARLATLYGDHARLTLNALPDGGVLAQLTLPLSFAS